MIVFEYMGAYLLIGVICTYISYLFEEQEITQDDRMPFAVLFLWPVLMPLWLALIAAQLAKKHGDAIRARKVDKRKNNK
jgi:uncharacterized membrane protein